MGKEEQRETGGWGRLKVDETLLEPAEGGGEGSDIDD